MEKKTLDQRIKEDLPQIYQLLQKQVVLKDIVESLEPISAAQKLSEKLFDGDDKEDDGFALSGYGLPGYFTGDRDAQTVMVMLNPGNDVLANDNPFNTMRYIKNYGISLETPEEFIRTYIKGYSDFGNHPTYKVDNFDMKQAVFLSDWKNTGVTIPEGFPDLLIENSGKDNRGKKKKVSEEIQKKIDALKEQATRNVLTQKLQLELIPYASRKFDTSTNHLEAMMPYLETLLDEIFRTERKYVIFCSDFFEKLFDYANGKRGIEIKFEEKQEKKIFEKEGNRGNAYCTPVRITYNNRPPIVAIIAHTFPVQSLPNAYEKMREYGRFCFERWNEIEK